MHAAPVTAWRLTGAPPRAQEDGFDARAGCQLLDALLEVAMQLLELQAVLLVCSMDEFQHLPEVVLPVEEEA